MLRALVTNFVGRDSSYKVDTDLGADFAQRSDSDFAWSRREGAVLDAEKQLHDLMATTTTAPAVRHICPVANTTTSPPAGRFIALKLSPGFASEIERETFALCIAGVEEDASR